MWHEYVVLFCQSSHEVYCTAPWGGHVFSYTRILFWHSSDLHVSLCVSAELQVRQPPSHPSPAAPSSSQEPASTTDLQRPPQRWPAAQPSSSTAPRPSTRHASPGTPAAPGDLHQLPSQPAAFPCGPLPLGLQQLPQLPQHPAQHAVTSHPQAELPAQRQPEQPLPSSHSHHRSTCAPTQQLQPATPQTPTKDIQKGAAAAAATRPVIGGEHRQQPVSLRCFF